jgi:hypothetical protein
MHSFVRRFACCLYGTLSGFDRVRFRGTQRLLACLRGLSRFLSFKSILLKEFPRFAQVVTATIKSQVESQAQSLGRPLLYLNSAQLRKEDLALELAHKHRVQEGLVGIFSAVDWLRSQR